MKKQIMTVILVKKEISDTNMRKLNVTEEELKGMLILNAYHELKNINLKKTILGAYEISVNKCLILI